MSEDMKHTSTLSKKRITRSITRGITMNLRLDPDPILHEIAAYVEYPTAHKTLVANMMRIMYQHRGVGLAAPQIGVSKRVIIAILPECGVRAMFNPKISKCTGTSRAVEQCLSLPGISVMVPRSKRIRIAYQDLYGDEKVLKLNGMDARIIQHEVDHINGIMITEYK